MNNQLQIFNNEQFGQVRMVEIENKPYFAAIDIANALGYSNPRDAIKRHCRWVAKHDVPHPQSENKTLEISVIPEGDMYRLISNSKLPSAEKFEKWVFDEVLPSIRKTGTYNSNPKGITKERVMAVIETLRDDEYKNEAVAGLLRLIPIEKKQMISASDELNLKALLDEFLQDESVILKPIEYGLAVSKEKLYDFFKPHGLKRTEVLRQLDNANLIFHREGCRTVQVNCGGYPVRVVVIKE